MDALRSFAGNVRDRRVLLRLGVALVVVAVFVVGGRWLSSDSPDRRPVADQQHGRRTQLQRPGASSPPTTASVPSEGDVPSGAAAAGLDDGDVPAGGACGVDGLSADERLSCLAAWASSPDDAAPVVPAASECASRRSADSLPDAVPEDWQRYTPVRPDNPRLEVRLPSGWSSMERDGRWAFVSPVDDRGRHAGVVVLAGPASGVSTAAAAAGAIRLFSETDGTGDLAGPEMVSGLEACRVVGTNHSADGGLVDEEFWFVRSGDTMWAFGLIADVGADSYRDALGVVASARLPETN